MYNMSAADLKLSRTFSGIDPNGMKWRGSWGIPGIYAYGDVVIGSNNESYICIDFSGSVGEDPTTNPAIWELLSSGSAVASTVVTAANGAGIVVAESPANTFTLSSGLIAGSGIALTPSGINSTQTVSNAGVLSVSAGTGISVGGTAQAPSVTNTGVTSLTTAPGSGLAVNFTTGDIQINKIYPSQSQLLDTRLTDDAALFAESTGGVVSLITNIPVVAGGVYTITAALAVQSTSSNPANQMFVAIAPSSGVAPIGQAYDLFSAPEATLGVGNGAAITFTVPAGITQYGVFVGGFGADGFGTITGTLFSLYLTRWS
jgi:hypothetical protein